MKVLLINPPTDNEITGTYPEVLDKEGGYNPPLGILLLAGYLLEHSNHKVEILDTQVEELTTKVLEERLRNTDFDVAGITVMTFLLVDVINVVKLVKKVKPETRVVLGGPHVNLYPEETINLEGVDLVVLGEGEIVFKELLDNINNEKKLKSIKGLLYKNREGSIVRTGVPETIKNLDNLSFPARHLTLYRKYGSILAVRTPVTTMMTSRGCPFKCTFCDRPHLGKEFRAMSAERVVEEIEEALKLGIHEFLFYDDTFTINKNRVKEICKLIVSKQLDIGFEIRSRVDTVDEEMLDLLKKAGCRGIHYGVEAGTEKILKVLGKGIRLEKVKKIFELTKKFKMNTLGYFMIGCPTETREDIYETFRVAGWLNPDYFHLSILSPFPGTKIYFEGLNKGIIRKDLWKEFSRNPEKNFKMVYWKENFTREELEKLLMEGYKKFYIRPSYIMKQFLKIKSFGELIRKAKAGIKVLFMKK